MKGIIRIVIVAVAVIMLSRASAYAGSNVTMQYNSSGQKTTTVTVWSDANQVSTITLPSLSCSAPVAFPNGTNEWVIATQGWQGLLTCDQSQCSFASVGDPVTSLWCGVATQLQTIFIGAIQATTSAATASIKPTVKAWIYRGGKWVQQ